MISGVIYSQVDHTLKEININFREYNDWALKISMNETLD